MPYALIDIGYDETCNNNSHSQIHFDINSMEHMFRTCLTRFLSAVVGFFGSWVDEDSKVSPVMREVNVKI